MQIKRLYHILRLYLISSDSGRANYCKKHGIFASVGEKVRIMDRKIPLYSRLIKFHNNIQVASNVHFITHDATYAVLNCANADYNWEGRYSEHIGCIEVMDNVFIGSNTTVLGGGYE